MKHATFLIAAAGLALPVSAEVVAASPGHYTLTHEAVSALSPEDMWQRLIQPEIWWSSAHTWSGDAANLSLDPQAGGLWREDWDGNSVAHGTVLSLMEGQSLRLDAPFGPLQGMGVTVIWTMTIEPNGDGTRVTFEETANGSPASSLDQIAPAVDGVKQQAIERLAAAQQ